MSDNPVWSWDDVQSSKRKPMQFGGAKRPSGGSMSRFQGHSAHAVREGAALSATHPAVTEGRTLFPTTVIAPDEAPRLLVSGHNSAKIGAKITKGPWCGFPVFTLTLEERATCPSSCSLWRECYGNAMPLARRHAHGPMLIDYLECEIAEKARLHPKGFAIRAHVLGDFWSADYVRAWHQWMATVPQLHVWGYTAYPIDSEIGQSIDLGNRLWADRWAFRFSVAPDAALANGQATTIWRRPEEPVVPEGIVCPAQTGATDACSTCGLCWAPAVRERRIVFIGHGMRKRGSK